MHPIAAITGFGEQRLAMQGVQMIVALAGVSLAEADDHLDALHSEALLTEAGYRRYGMG